MKLTRTSVRGASLVEYGLLTGLVAVVAIAAVSATGLTAAYQAAVFNCRATSRRLVMSAARAT